VTVRRTGGRRLRAQTTRTGATAWIAGAPPRGAPERLNYLIDMRYFGGSKPLARQRAAIPAEVSAAMKARAATGSVLLAGIAAA
jgi:hypothetical protein